MLNCRNIDTFNNSVFFLTDYYLIIYLTRARFKVTDIFFLFSIILRQSK